MEDITLEVGQEFRVIAGMERGLIGRVTAIPAKNGDAFEGEIIRNSGKPGLDFIIGCVLSYPWEIVEPVSE